MPAASVRRDFPAFRERPGAAPFVYLDSAATSWKPQSVLDAVRRYDVECSANVHRATYAIAEEATLAYEGAREELGAFLGADPKTIVFTRGATDAIHVVAAGLCLQPDDRILV